MDFKTTVILLTFAIVSINAHAYPSVDKTHESNSNTDNVVAAKPKREASSLEKNLQPDSTQLKLDSGILETIQAQHEIQKRGVWGRVKSKYNNRQLRLAQERLIKANANLQAAQASVQRRLAVVAQAREEVNKLSGGTSAGSESGQDSEED